MQQNLSTKTCIIPPASFVLPVPEVAWWSLARDLCVTGVLGLLSKSSVPCSKLYQGILQLACIQTALEMTKYKTLYRFPSPLEKGQYTSFASSHHDILKDLVGHPADPAQAVRLLQDGPGVRVWQGGQALLLGGRGSCRNLNGKPILPKWDALVGMEIFKYQCKVLREPLCFQDFIMGVQTQ